MDKAPLPNPDAQGAIHPALAATLAARGYDVLTPVQRAVLDPAHDAADLLVSAQTGSGKTVAFGLAIASTLLGEAPAFARAAAPLALVIAPTRELALQVGRELDWLYADAGVVTASSVGGLDSRTERRALERGAHIVVGTPGRLRDHITRGALDLSAIRAIVLDEADEMLDLGFREDLEFILGAAPEERRTLMFSATVPPPIAQLARTFQRDAVRLSATASTERHADIDYQILLVDAAEREQAIVNALLYYDSTSTMVFCHTREAVKHLTARLANRGFAVVTLSGELSQAERSNALQAMRDGRARVCVATDVAARGIDLPNLDLVIHADLPSNPDTLLHRSGRTGRAGRKGICVLVVPAYRRAAALRVLRLANVEAQVRNPPSAAEIDIRQRRQLLDEAMAAPAPAEDESEMVGALLEAVPADLLAVLYLRSQRAARPVPEEITEVSLADPRARPVTAFEPRRDQGDGVWFTLSVGRKQRADPKWLLPVICKAGGVGKRDIGTISIGEAETRFEIVAGKAEAFARRVAQPGAVEKGIVIAPAEAGLAAAPPPGRPKGAKGKFAGRKPGPDGQRPEKPRRERPAEASEAAAPAAGKPARPTPPRGAEERPGKPRRKWDPAGQQPRKRPKDKAKGKGEPRA